DEVDPFAQRLRNTLERVSTVKHGNAARPTARVIGPLDVYVKFIEALLREGLQRNVRFDIYPNLELIANVCDHLFFGYFLAARDVAHARKAASWAVPECD